MPPPAVLLSSDSATPEARTLIAEVRTNATLPFDPKVAPTFLFLPNVGFCALILWRVDVSWSQAQQIQLWLTGAPGAPAGALFPTREEALKDFLEGLQAGTPPAPFLKYVGTYLETGLSHARYTLVLGMQTPIGQDLLLSTVRDGIADVEASARTVGGAWQTELIAFFKMIFNQPSTYKELLTLAANVGDLAKSGPPVIRMLVT
jgi:hypothetical protein